MVYGTRGSIDCNDWSSNGEWPLSCEGMGELDRITSGSRLPTVESVHHMKNWLDCLRTRQEPNAPMEAGHAHAVAGILADESYVRGRRMVYAPPQREIAEE